MRPFAQKGRPAACGRQAGQHHEHPVSDAGHSPDRGIVVLVGVKAVEELPATGTVDQPEQFHSVHAGTIGAPRDGVNYKNIKVAAYRLPLRR